MQSELFSPEQKAMGRLAPVHTENWLLRSYDHHSTRIAVIKIRVFHLIPLIKKIHAVFAGLVQKRTNGKHQDGTSILFE